MRKNNDISFNVSYNNCVFFLYTSTILRASFSRFIFSFERFIFLYIIFFFISIFSAFAEARYEAWNFLFTFFAHNLYRTNSLNYNDTNILMELTVLGAL